MRYALGVGSNRGNRRALLDRAAALLPDAGLSLLRRSEALDNPPLGLPPGAGHFLNEAWLVETALGPHQLLARLRGIERACGRTRSGACLSRLLDLDLLLAADGRCITSPVLTLPHPRLHERCFVLQPLAQIVPDWQHPLLRRSVEELWRDLSQGRNQVPSR